MAKRSAEKATGAALRPKAPPAVRSADRPAVPGRGRVLVLGGTLALVVIAAVLALVPARNGSAASTPRVIPWSQLGALQTGRPPWSNGAGRLTHRLAPLGLSRLGAEGTALHIHQHLDLYVSGKRVALPAGVGIYDNSYITELHTHDTSGVIHVESPNQRTFTLGQLFGEWGVKLTSSCVGRYCGHVKWWVNGKRMSGDPAALALKARQEIAIVAGPPPLVVPKSYAFPPGA